MNKVVSNVAAAVLGSIVALASVGAIAETGVTNDTVLIGAYGPVTGPAAFIGIGGRDGAELALQEINAAGGVHGRKLRMIFEDDGFSPAKALRLQPRRS